MHQEIQRMMIERDMRQLFEQRLPEQIRRYLEFRPHQIIANQYFSAVSAECIELFREGHFYGCIALTQAMAEALVKFLCRKNGWRPNKVFERNVEKLLKRTFISDSASRCLLQIWNKRDDYHHVNANIETDRRKLEPLVMERVKFLNDVEAEIFHYTFVNGKIKPTLPQYWDKDGDKVGVWLRCE